MEFDPLLATYCGDHRYNDRLPEMTESAMTEWVGRLRGFINRLLDLSRDTLEGQELLNYDIFMRLLVDEIEEIGYRGYLMPISKAGGFHTYLPESLPTIMPFENARDYEVYLKRMAAFPPYSDQHIELMTQGLRDGYIPSKVTLEGVAEQVRAQITDPVEASLWYEPFQRIPESIGEAERQRLQAAGREVLARGIPRLRTPAEVPGGRIRACICRGGRRLAAAGRAEILPAPHPPVHLAGADRGTGAPGRAGGSAPHPPGDGSRAGKRRVRGHCQLQRIFETRAALLCEDEGGAAEGNGVDPEAHGWRASGAV